jgi:tetratricopeptide (TPR) repeat protein
MSIFLGKLKCFVTLIISGVSVVGAWGQTSQQCLTLAQQQYKLQHFPEVIDLYERISFFNKEILTQEDYQKWAQSYFETKDIEKAIDMYAVAANVAVADSARYHFLFKVILCQILQSSYQESLVSLYNLPDSLPPFYTHSRDLYL